MKKLVIFDMDGTLIDSLPDIMSRLNSTMERFGYPKLDRNATMDIIGNGARELVKDAVPEKISEQKLEEMYDDFCSFYKGDFGSKTKVFDGIMEVLETLTNKGYLLAIVTNKAQFGAEATCKKFFPNVVFSKIVGQSDDYPVKPHPASTIALLKELKVNPENAYFIGDGETDYLTSKNANVNGISCLWGYRSKEFLSSFGASVFVDIPKDILTLLGE